MYTGKKKHTIRFTILNVDSRGKPKIGDNKKRGRNESTDGTDPTQTSSVHGKCSNLDPTLDRTI